MCDVLSIDVSCSECTECFSDVASKFFFKTFVTIPVAPSIAGVIIHFLFHIRILLLLLLLLLLSPNSR
jgi:hypothetical protein